MPEEGVPGDLRMDAEKNTCNNYYDHIYENDNRLDDHGLKEIPNAWLNRLLPSTEPMKGADWQKVFGRVFFLDDHGVFRPLDMERVLAGEMSHFNDLTGLPYNVGEILQQFTTLPLYRIHHYANTGEYLRALFDERKLVDVLIHVQDKMFAAHRVALACHSVYFARAFILNQHQKHKLTEIKLKNIDPHMFFTVLKFIYSGQLYLNGSNMHGLLHVANQLQIPAVLFRCLDFAGQMPIKRAIDVIGEPNPKIIRNQAQRILRMHIRDIRHNPSFLKMGIEAVEMALGDDDVLIDEESDVFYAAMAWLAYDLGPRRKHLERLMRQVRFTCMTPAEVIEATQFNNMIRNSPFCRNRVLEAIWLMTIKGYRTSDALKCHCPKPRNCLQGKGPQPFVRTETYYYNDPHGDADPYGHPGQGPDYNSPQAGGHYFPPDADGGMGDPVLNNHYENEEGQFPTYPTGMTNTETGNDGHFFDERAPRAQHCNDNNPSHKLPNALTHKQDSQAAISTGVNVLHPYDFEGQGKAQHQPSAQDFDQQTPGDSGQRFIGRPLNDIPTVSFQENPISEFDDRERGPQPHPHGLSAFDSALDPNAPLPSNQSYQPNQPATAGSRTASYASANRSENTSKLALGSAKSPRDPSVMSVQNPNAQSSRDSTSMSVRAPSTKSSRVPAAGYTWEPNTQSLQGPNAVSVRDPGSLRDPSSMSVRDPGSLRDPSAMSVRDPGSLRDPSSMSVRDPGSLRDPSTMSVRDPGALRDPSTMSVRDPGTLGDPRAMSIRGAGATSPLGASTMSVRDPGTRRDPSTMSVRDPGALRDPSTVSVLDQGTRRDLSTMSVRGAGATSPPSASTMSVRDPGTRGGPSTLSVRDQGTRREPSTTSVRDPGTLRDPSTMSVLDPVTASVRDPSSMSVRSTGILHDSSKMSAWNSDAKSPRNPSTMSLRGLNAQPLQNPSAMSARDTDITSLEGTRITSLEVTRTTTLEGTRTTSLDGTRTTSLDGTRTTTLEGTRTTSLEGPGGMSEMGAYATSPHNPSAMSLRDPREKSPHDPSTMSRQDLNEQTLRGPSAMSVRAKSLGDPSAMDVGSPSAKSLRHASAMSVKDSNKPPLRSPSARSARDQTAKSSGDPSAIDVESPSVKSLRHASVMSVKDSHEPSLRGPSAMSVQDITAKSLRDHDSTFLRNSNEQSMRGPSATSLRNPSGKSLHDPHGMSLRDTETQSPRDPSAMSAKGSSKMLVRDSSAKFPRSPNAMSLRSPNASAMSVQNSNAMSARDLYAKSTRDPSSTSLRNPSVKSLHNASALSLRNPSANSIRDPSTTNLRSPNTKSLQNPSSMSLRSPSGMSVGATSPKLARDPSSTFVRSPSTKSLHSPSASHLRSPSGTSLQASGSKVLRGASRTLLGTPSTKSLNVTSATSLHRPAAPSSILRQSPSRTPGSLGRMISSSLIGSPSVVHTSSFNDIRKSASATVTPSPPPPAAPSPPIVYTSFHDEPEPPPPPSSDEEVPFFKLYASQFDAEDIEGRVTGVEVAFQRKKVSPSSHRRRRRSGNGDGNAEAGAKQTETADPFSGGDILAVGGYIDTDNITGSSHAQILDCSQNKWQRFSEMPETRLNFAAAYLNGVLYIIGGYDPSRAKSGAHATKDNFRFDTYTQKWECGGSMRTARSFHALCCLGGRIYAMGGQDENQGVLDSVEVYDPGADRWSSVAAMLYNRVGACAATLKGRVMVVGGYGESSDDTCPVLLSTEWFDPATNRWKARGNLRIPRAQACMVEVNKRLYLCGGATRHQSTGVLCSLHDVDCFDPSTDTWTQISSLQTARHNAGATVIGSKIYVVGGVSTDTNQVLRSVECYDTDTDQWDTSLPDLPIGAKSLACVVIAT